MPLSEEEWRDRTDWLCDDTIVKARTAKVSAHQKVVADMLARGVEGEGNTLGTGGMYPRVRASGEEGFRDSRRGSPGPVNLASWMRMGDDGGETISSQYVTQMERNIEQLEIKLLSSVERSDSSSLPSTNNSVRSFWLSPTEGREGGEREQ